MVVGARARAGRRRVPRHAGRSLGHAGRHVLRADRRCRRPYVLLTAAGRTDPRAELAPAATLLGGVLLEDFPVELDAEARLGRDVDPAASLAERHIGEVLA